MKKYQVAATLLALCPAAVMGQSSRSIAVWNAGEPSYFSINATDSLKYESDETLAVYSGGVRESFDTRNIDSVTVVSPAVTNTNSRSDDELAAEFSSLTFSSTAYKKVGNGNPLMGHKFGADPFAMVDGDRVYIYMTDDHLYKDNGEVIKEGYGDTRRISIISSEDLVNWSDHGAQPVAGSGAPASWANNSWAPCAAHKTIDGKEKYFLYFADNGSGIGVLTADTPYGPWKLPKSGMKQLISRSTPNCGDVTWLFDPAVLVDDDGKAYLYFGGGVPDGKDSDPGTARCVQLGDDMISIVGTPQKINPPYLFEDSGINKVGGKYLYSYCSNWTGNSNPGVAKIAYMTSDSPLGPFKYVGAIFDNPGDAGWAGGGGNNHHAMFEFQGKYYMTYHTRALKSAMRKDWPDIADGAELRSACLSEMKVDTVKGTVTKLNASQTSITGVAQIRNFNPYANVPGATMAWERDITTSYDNVGNKFSKKMSCPAHAKAGSWMCLSNVDFKNGAVGLTLKAKGKGVIKFCNGTSKYNKAFALVEVQDDGNYKTYTVPVSNMPIGVSKKLYILFSGDISLESWSFF